MPVEWGPALAWCDLGRARPTPRSCPPSATPDGASAGPQARTTPALDELAQLVAGHLARFRIALPHEASALRRAFEARLLAFFRRHPVQAAAAFAWLALAALDLERLRGEIERRLAFPAARIAA